MKSKQLENLLTSMDLVSHAAVFFHDKNDGRIYKGFSSEIEKKLDIIQPDAFFVFNQQPFILFFDLTSELSSEREDRIHKQVWSFDYAPLAIIVKPTEIQVFNAFNYDKKSNRLEKISLTSDELSSKFSFWKLQSGRSWHWMAEEVYRSNIQKKRVNQMLFENIRFVRTILTDNQYIGSLQEDEANILILRLIFIRYLIDRGVKVDTDYISGSTITERRKSFIELIQKPRKLNSFFELLNEKFNGVLFKNTNVQLSKAQAVNLSNIFSGEIDTNPNSIFFGSDFYFEIFDFSIIPVEVISGIYESLISEETRNEHSAVYTPSFIVERILSDTVDPFLARSRNKECTVFDPSCGSGIFLVQSYRRMVDRQIEQGKQRLTKVRLREIAQNNLFGVDLNSQALKVTCFSIYIAMLDYQDPKTILDNFQFPSLLGENLFVADFFDSKNDFNDILKGKKIRFILGNPPWKDDKSPLHLQWINAANVYSKKISGEIEIASSFLLRCQSFMDSDTITALITTSTVFTNISSTAKQFKTRFLSSFLVDRYLDLSPVRHLIFEEKINPASIVYYRLRNSNHALDNLVLHESVKWNIFLKYFKTILVDRFDHKKIPQKLFLENEWMFKVCLYGSNLDYSLIKRLKSLGSNLLTFFDNKSAFKGGGFHKGSPGKYQCFKPIIDKKLIENKEVLKYYSRPYSNVRVKKEDAFIKSGRVAELYEGFQILIKEQAKEESEIVVSLTNEAYAFRSGVFGLTSKDPEFIYFVYAIMVSRLYEYYIFMISGSWGASTRPQIRLDDEFLSFPIPDTDPKIKKGIVELVKKFIGPFEEYYNKPVQLGLPYFKVKDLDAINLAVNELFGISAYEKDLIDYTLSVSRYQFQENKQKLFRKKINDKPEILQKYASIFSHELKLIYEEHFAIDVYLMDEFIAIHFVYNSNKAQKDEITIHTEESYVQRFFAQVGKLSHSKLSAGTNAENIFVQSDLKGFEKDSFYIIKPNELRCWHPAMAWYDFADIKQQIEQAELKYLKQHAHAS